jgi:hypothetical protein
MKLFFAVESVGPPRFHSRIPGLAVDGSGFVVNACLYEALRSGRAVVVSFNLQRFTNSALDPTLGFL